MDNFRLILIIVAVLAFVALFIHEFLINKKERSNIFNSQKKNNKNPLSSANISWDIANEDDAEMAGEVKTKLPTTALPAETTHKMDENLRNDDQPLYSSPVQRDLFADDLEPEFKIADVPTNILDSSCDQNATSTKNTATKAKKEDVIVLHVVGINNGYLDGDILLTSILQSGFLFGDMQIFHRHVDPAGNGSVLFSLANMVKPGYFDPERMHELVTPGISIFMMVPSFGNTQQNFKMMLQAAQRIADDVNGVVLDDEHHLITPQKIDSYKERIKSVID